MLHERQDIVYRNQPEVDGSQPPPAQPAATGAHISHVDPTSTMLFRYSAITFNGHRIHYDSPYARDVEAYDGLVVHSPMQATFMAQLASEVKGRPPKRFSYRGKSPLFAGSPFTVNATETDDGMSLWTAGTDGPIAMQAFANW